MIYLSLCSYELMVYWENVDYLWLKVEWIFLHCYNLVKLFTLWLFVFYSGQSYLTLADERMTLNWMIVYDSKHRTNAVHLSTQWVLSLLDWLNFCTYTHITPILKSLHWLKVNERIEYKLLCLTYKVLITAQHSYLHNLISLQPPRSTRSSSVVTLSRRQPSPLWKSQITHLDMHHLVFGINFQIHSVRQTILVSIHLLIHFSISSLSSSPL